ncbi:hypothetical protein [Salibaculum griseiflavum]|uniref:hypothetical protein n=1 Tax=Salibaculum griseiflavum TaxID=1914409 RepID=UPI001C38C66C|nr:hypothetical protein [Salibaculum griseiflavum]
MACYDAVFNYQQPEDKADSEAAESTETIEGENLSGNSWVLVEQEDGFTEADISYVYLESAQAGTGMQNLDALLIRCNGEGGTEILIVSSGFLGNDRLRVRYRFDDNEPISERWSPSTDGQAAFLPSGYRDFRSGLTSSDGVLIEVEAFNGARHQGEFDGLRNNTEDRDFVLSGCKSDS